MGKHTVTHIHILQREPEQFVKTTVTACICPLAGTHIHLHRAAHAYVYFCGVRCLASRKQQIQFLFPVPKRKRERERLVLICTYFWLHTDLLPLCNRHRNSNSTSNRNRIRIRNGKVRRQKGNICCKRPLTCPNPKETVQGKNQKRNISLTYFVCSTDIPYWYNFCSFFASRQLLSAA